MGVQICLGPLFYKALYKRAKRHKHSAEIKWELASQFKPKTRTPGHSRGNHHGFTKKPFQGGSTQNQHFRTNHGANQGGNQSRGRGQKTRGFGKPKSGYVYLFSNKTSHIRQGSCPTYKLHYPRPSAGQISPRTQTAKLDNVRLPRSGGGSDRLLPTKLGKNNKRSMDLAARQGDKSRADQPSHTDSGTVLPKILKNGNQSTIPRSGRVVKQGGSGEDSSLTRSVSGTSLPSSKKDGSYRPVFNMKELNQFVQYEKFKMEDVPMHAIGEKRLDDKNRSQRCLFLPTHSGRTQEIVQIQVEECPPTIPGMSIRVGLGYDNFQEDSEASNRSMSTPREQDINIPRRSVAHESRQAAGDGGHKSVIWILQHLDFVIHWKKINSNTTTTAEISRIQHQLSRVNPGITTGQSPGNSRRVSTVASGATGVSPMFGQADRKADGHSPGGIASPSTLSTATNVADKSTASRQPKLWHQDRSERAMSRRVNVVDTLPHIMEWEVHTVPMSGFGDNVGFVENRMGCNLQPGDHTGSMEHG